jgi:hypothetical protein
VTATVGAKSGTLTLSLALSGVNNATFSLTGPEIGNSFSAQGTFQGQGVTYFGYFEQTIDVSAGGEVQSVYLVNADDDCLTNSNTTSTVLQALMTQ